MWWMNADELKEAIRKHCGEKMKNGEEICDSCSKKLFRARKINKEKNYLWKMKERGLLYKLEEQSSKGKFNER